MPLVVPLTHSQRLMGLLTEVNGFKRFSVPEEDEGENSQVEDPEKLSGRGIFCF